MTERNDLLASIAETTADYREGDLAAPKPEHVERWANQFDAAVQLSIRRTWLCGLFCLRARWLSTTSSGCFCRRLSRLP